MLLSNDGGLSLSERRMIMGTIIGIIVAALGALFYDIDFWTLYKFVTIGIRIYRIVNKLTSDKTALQ